MIESIEVIFPVVAESATVVFPSPLASDVAVIPRPGPNGLTAYEVAVANGFAGSEEEWLESLVGPSGSAANVTTANVGSALAASDPKAAPADSDNLTILDSAASNATKLLSFFDLWAWIVTKLTALASIDGAKTFLQNVVFSGASNRMPNQTAATLDSLMTRLLVVQEKYARLGMSFGDEVPTVSGTGGGSASVSGTMATLTLSGAAPSSYRYASYGTINAQGANTGAAFHFAKKFIMGARFWLSDLESGNGVLRFYPAMPYSPGPYKFSDQAFATGNSVAVEISKTGSGAGAAYIAKILYFNGTAQASAGYTFYTGSAPGHRCYSFALTNDGAGNLSLWVTSYVMGTSASPQRIDFASAPNQSVSGGPTGASPIYGITPIAIASTSTTGPAAAASMQIQIQAFRIDLLE